MPAPRSASCNRLNEGLWHETAECPVVAAAMDATTDARAPRRSARPSRAHSDESRTRAASSSAPALVFNSQRRPQPGQTPAPAHAAIRRKPLPHRPTRARARRPLACRPTRRCHAHKGSELCAQFPASAARRAAASARFAQPQQGRFGRHVLGKQLRRPQKQRRTRLQEEAHRPHRRDCARRRSSPASESPARSGTTTSPPTSRETTTSPPRRLPVADEPYYVLLLGGDSREGGDVKTEADEGNRTDSMMVARVDEKNKKVDLLSVPRDTRVYIEGHGHQTINPAIEFGGYDLAIKEVNELLGVGDWTTDAFIYFSGFEDLVDKLGGVTVEGPEGTEYAGVRVPAGDAVTINGQEALVLARCRHWRAGRSGRLRHGRVPAHAQPAQPHQGHRQRRFSSRTRRRCPTSSRAFPSASRPTWTSRASSSLRPTCAAWTSKATSCRAPSPKLAPPSTRSPWYGVIFQLTLFPTLQKNFIAGKVPVRWLPQQLRRRAYRR